MAERRMFAKSVVLSDEFLDLPNATKNLYYTFGMMADDDGFVNSAKSIIRLCGATNKDFEVLLSHGFLIAFDSGVVAITHWKVNNYIRNDRYAPTKHVKERALLKIDARDWYTRRSTKRDTTGETVGIPRLGKDRLGKDRLGQDRLGQESVCSTPAPSREDTHKKDVPKKPYGQYKNVLLTDEEYSTLQEKHGASLAEHIERLSRGIELYGYRYQSHFLALENWIADYNEKHPVSHTPSSFDTDEFFRLALARSYGENLP